MVYEENKNDMAEAPPPPDESWWEAILQDVESRFATKGTNSAKSTNNGFHDVGGNDDQVEIDWGLVNQLFSQDQIVNLKVYDCNRGGLLVAGNGIQGFVPLSHIVLDDGQSFEEAETDKLKDFIGQEMPLKIIECDEERGRIVLSARAAQATPGIRLKILNDLKPGQVVTGVVTTITDFGVFVELGGVEGLVHISELSWGRVHRPEDLLEVGELIEAYVLQVDKNRARIALSLKRLHENPWENIEERYHIGQVLDAVITSIVPYGAFARLEDGLDGLIHVSEFGPNHQEEHGTDHFLSEGQKVKVSILHIDAEKQRLGLSLNIQ